MIYIRNLFTQDLRDGKQIAFPTEPSNVFFKFNFNSNDPERRITFKFIEKDSHSVNFAFNQRSISTRLYSAGTESRIDGELKQFLRDDLKAKIDDVLVFRVVNLNLYEFQFIPSTVNTYDVYKSILNGKNHETVIIQNEDEQQNSSTSEIVALNIIYYGAPGTGKSHKVDKIIEDLDTKYYERVTFHPEFDNTSFIGGYKPTSIIVEYEKDEDKYFRNEVNYEFVPQAFTNIYERAWRDLNNQYYLVIEEINRGNCAEIFGEIFQLLDRTSNYTVSPTKELKEYLENNAFENEKHEGIVNGLKLPPNLSILATMNTSDQSLFPMDSAFKRRWDWEYIPICYDPKDDFGNDNDSFDFEIDIDNGSTYSWIKFIEKINLNHVKNNPSLGMDKCIGNYFIKPDKDKTVTLKPFINKVIFYLWNDVFKDEDNKVFEVNTSYEDFFPININGKKKIKELFDRIELQPKKSLEIVEDDSQLGQVAEDTETIGS